MKMTNGINISVFERNALVENFGMEEIEAFIQNSQNAFCKEFGREDDLPEILAHTLTEKGFCMELNVVTEHGCFQFLAAPYKIYGDIFPRPENSKNMYHYETRFMPNEMIRKFSTWLSKIDGPIDLLEKRKSKRKI
ncbi:hypothetical protein [Paenibacillus konkukensis]|uniref:hypothetical protein n=1 Tax=Paenibacillus konkukensis TaxID=2020716 RepID=UPI00201DA517|nr:hypothetical protein [Paenibacillus konkukensis]